MSGPNPPEFDPYQAPEHAGDDVSGPPGVVDATLLKQFHDQIIALGALWILLGAGAGALAIFALQGNEDLSRAMGGGVRVLLIITAAMGATWFVLGLFTCAKRVWAVYAGLVLSYLSLLANLVNLNICSIVIVLVVILQAHRVISWSRKIRAAGLPLDARPGPGRG